MGIEILHYQANLLHVGIILINKFLDKVCPINFRSLIRDFLSCVDPLKVQKP